MLHCVFIGSSQFKTTANVSLCEVSLLICNIRYESMTLYVTNYLQTSSSEADDNDGLPKIGQAFSLQGFMSDADDVITLD